MKITVVKKAQETRKPKNFCPWWIEDGVTETEKK